MYQVCLKQTEGTRNFDPIGINFGESHYSSPSDIYILRTKAYSGLKLCVDCEEKT